jgi:hypothetical protein
VMELSKLPMYITPHSSFIAALQNLVRSFIVQRSSFIAALRVVS